MSGFLDLHLPKWLRVLITRSAAIVPTVAVALYFNAPSTQLPNAATLSVPAALPSHPFSSAIGHSAAASGSLAAGDSLVQAGLSRSLSSSPLHTLTSPAAILYQLLNATHSAPATLQHPHESLTISHSLSSPLSPLPPLSSPSALDSLNEWLNVLQSVQLPFAVVPLLAIAASPRVMGPFALKGKRYVSEHVAACLLIL